MKMQNINNNNMRKYIDIKKIGLAVFEYIWAFVIVMNGNSVYNANADKNYNLTLLCVITTITIIIANIVFVNKRINKQNVIYSIIISAYTLIYLIICKNRMSATNFTYLFVIGLPCLYILFSELKRNNRIYIVMYRIGDIVFCLAAISIIMWVFGTILEILKPNMTTIIKWGNYGSINGYYGLHFNIQKDATFGTYLYRNSGIFTEAPMLNLWCDFALAIELFLKRKSDKLRIIVIVITILTTFSITGLGFLALCFSLKYYESYNRIKRNTKIISISFLMGIIPIFIVLFIYIIILKSKTLSFAMRMSDYIDGVRMWTDYPVFGSGYANLQSLYEYIYSPNGIIGFSNSIIAVLATGGVWMASIFYIPHVAVIFPKVTRSKCLSMFCICYFYLFCTTAFFARYLAVLMIAFELAIMTKKIYRK